MLLTITIPTYNRRDFLIKNLKSLVLAIYANSFQKEINIFISDNGSTDGTEFSVKRFCQVNNQIQITYYKHKINHGVTHNQIFCLTNVKSEYFMTLGDDDYIDEKYIKEAIMTLKSDSDISCIIPSYREITIDGKIIKNIHRDINIKPEISPPSFNTCLKHSWRGHQLSGLIYRSQGLISELKRKHVFNIYPFIFCIAYSSIHGKVYHLTQHPVLVTHPGQENKNWTYKKDGLITEIFNNYRLIFPRNTMKRFVLEMKFVSLQSWRLKINLRKNRSYIFIALYNIIKSNNTSLPTKFFLPLYMLYDLTINALIKSFDLCKQYIIDRSIYNDKEHSTSVVKYLLKK